MMDASAMYPQGFHPIAPSLLPNDVSRLAPVMPRASVPVTYYYVDFGISTLFTPEETNRMVTGLAGLDRDVPELSKDVPYDPFKVDIFILGNLFKQSFLDVRSHNLTCHRVVTQVAEIQQRRYPVPADLFYAQPRSCGEAQCH